LSTRSSLAYFPYELREGQLDFLSYVRSEVKGRDVVVNATTGFGKTPLILAALLPLALHDGRQIIWAVRTGTETDRPIEELKMINKSTGKRVFGVSFRGKRDMCLLWRDLKIKGELENEDITFLCKAHKEKCKYYVNFSKVHSFNDFAENPKLYSETLNYCEKEEICPYMLQSSLLSDAIVVALNYNYVINDAISWAMRRRINYKSSFLVVDEAHNLQNACSNINSDQITLGTIGFAIREVLGFHTAKAGEIEEFLRLMHEYFVETLKGIGEDEVVFDVDGCIRHCARNLDGFESSIRTMNRLGVRIRRGRLAEGKAPRSSLYRLSRFWISALGNLGVEGVVFLASKERGRNLVVEMWDMRACEILRDIWGNFYRCIFCSGTIKPIDPFAEIIGLQKYSGKVFPSPFTERNAISLITEDLTTEGEELGSDMAKSYVAAINGLIVSLNTNVAVFSASYRIQDTLLKHGLEEAVKENGRRFFLEEQGMPGKYSRKILDDFKACAYGDETGVLCATMTGRYAEGADFPGKELEGIFLVGVPFDRMTTRTRLYLDYYQSIYGKEKGTFYAYILPAVKRASQSLGRALRSKQDRAIFVLGDKRYERFISLLPDFVQRNVKKIKSDRETLEKEVKGFWGETAPLPFKKIHKGKE